MLRRNFFATLLAPLVARFAPKVTIFKARSVGPTVPSQHHYVEFDLITEKATADSFLVTDWYTNTGHYRQIGNGPIEFVGNWPNPMFYWTNPMNPDSWDLDA